MLRVIQLHMMRRRTLLPLLAYSIIIVVVIIFPPPFPSCHHWQCHALVVVNNPSSVVVPFSLLGRGRSSSSSHAQHQRSTFHRQHMTTSSEFSTSTPLSSTIITLFSVITSSSFSVCLCPPSSIINYSTPPSSYSLLLPFYIIHPITMWFTL